MKRAAIVCLTTVVVFLCTVQALGSLSFTVLGDWGFVLNYADQVGYRSASYGASFMLGLGDNFYAGLYDGVSHGHGIAGLDDPRWKTIYENVFVHPWFLSHKFYVIAGNHDYEGNEQAQIAYTKIAPQKQWTFPRKYYTIHKKVGKLTVDIFMMDTTPLAYSDKELKKHFGISPDRKQIPWLKRALARSKATWKIVVGHHQIYEGRGQTRLAKIIPPLLEKYKVPAYINGHIHNIQHLKSKSGIHYMTIGSAAVFKATPVSKPAKGLKSLLLYPSKAQASSAACASRTCRTYAVFTIKNAKTMIVRYFNAAGAMLKTIEIKNRK